jgi:hypothetical protein
MLSKRSIAAVFVVAIASSLIVVISSSFVDSAYAFAAAKKIRQYQQDINPAAVVPFSGLSAGLDEDGSRSVTSHVLNANGWDWTFGDDSGFIAKEVHMWKEECNDA